MKDLNTQFYTNSYEKYGISAKGVHWHSKKTQYIRFEILITFLDNIENSSIIDIGCGFAEILNFFEEKKIKPDIYLGLDCEEFMIETSRKRFPKHLFLKCNILKHEIPTADYLICSGALNILTKQDFLKAIEYCFNSSKKGFAFNFLKENSIHKLEKKDILKYCKSLTLKVTIRDNYLVNDCSFFLEK